MRILYPWPDQKALKLAVLSLARVKDATFAKGHAGANCYFYGYSPSGKVVAAILPKVQIFFKIVIKSLVKYQFGVAGNGLSSSPRLSSLKRILSNAKTNHKLVVNHIALFSFYSKNNHKRPTVKLFV